MEKAVITAPKEKAVKPPSNGGGAVVKKPGVVKGGSKPDAKKPAAVAPKKPVVASTPPYDEEEEKQTGLKSSAVSQRGAAKVAGTNATKVAAKKAPPAAPKIIDEPIGSNLPINNLKSQRISDEMRLKILKWNFSIPREEFIDLLKELMTAAGIGPTLMGNMFHSNFKLHLKALDTLQEVRLLYKSNWHRNCICNKFNIFFKGIQLESRGNQVQSRLNFEMGDSPFL